MAVMSGVDISSQLSNNLERLDITSECNNKTQSIEEKWGLPATEVYKLAVSFYKEQEGKAVQLSYEDKLQLVAFSQQVNHGPLSTCDVPPVGALDVVGRDRRLAWQRLGSLSAEQARTGFITLLARRCPLLEAYVEAHRRDQIEQERKAREEAKLEEERKKKQKEEEKIQRELQAQQEREELARRRIQQALNEQTYEQFRAYAEQQFPGDPERQGELVRQLQEQHYLQYMQQLQATANQPVDASAGETTPEESAPEENNDSTLQPASMWTRADIHAFKETIASSEGDGVVRVGHGETVTVRVPTHREGTRLFWEFATDHYDIGFGVYFEWGPPTTDQVSVHVSESEDDEEDEEEFDEYDNTEYLQNLSRSDLESGLTGGANTASNRPIVTELVPVFRRDCQNEVYAGSHTYPGQGVYLLKFDNSYSLWRSKTLYYRVYYTH